MGVPPTYLGLLYRKQTKKAIADKNEDTEKEDLPSTLHPRYDSNVTI